MMDYILGGQRFLKILWNVFKSSVVSLESFGPPNYNPAFFIDFHIGIKVADHSVDWLSCIVTLANHRRATGAEPSMLFF